LVIVFLSPAYVHRSDGRPGWDEGQGGYQSATLTFDEAAPFALPTKLPAVISDGFLRVSETTYEGLIPVSGVFEPDVEFCILLTTAERFTLRSRRVTIQIHGEPSSSEEFKRQ
jgi:hypothetical protein